MALDPRFLLVALVVGVGLALAAVGRFVPRFRSDEAVLASLAGIACLAFVSWTPQVVRDPILALLIGVSLAATASQNRFLTLMLGGGVLYGLSFLVPGGASPLVLALVAFAGSAAIAEARGHVRRVAEARALDPTAPTERQVQIGGTIDGAPVRGLPLCPEFVAAYQVTLEDGTVVASPEVLRLRTPLGPAEVHTARVRFDVGQAHQRNADGDVELAALFAAEPKGPIAWLEHGAEVCAVGVPSWKPTTEGRGYRQSGAMPVFGAAPGREGEPAAWIGDVPLPRMISRARWLALAWGAWIPVALTIGIGQLLGWAP